MSKAINKKILLISLSIKLKIKYKANAPEGRFLNKLYTDTVIIINNLGIVLFNFRDSLHQL